MDKLFGKANFPVNAPLNDMGMTAIHYAAIHGNAYMLNLLIVKYGANVGKKDKVKIFGYQFYPSV